MLLYALKVPYYSHVHIIQTNLSFYSVVSLQIGNGIYMLHAVELTIYLLYEVRWRTTTLFYFLIVVYKNHNDKTAIYLMDKLHLLRPF